MNSEKILAVLEAARLGPVRAGPFREFVLECDRSEFVLHGVYRANVATVAQAFSTVKTFDARPLVLNRGERANPCAAFVKKLASLDSEECDLLVLIQRQRSAAPMPIRRASGAAAIACDLQTGKVVADCVLPAWPGADYGESPIPRLRARIIWQLGGWLTGPR